MLFDPDSFFGEARALTDDPDDEAEPEENFATPNLVDATYRIALRRYGNGWTFAVDMVCTSGSDDPRACAPKLRLVSFRKRDEIPASVRERLEDHLPTSPAEAATEFREIAKWEEADLRTCPGALRQLLRFPAQRGDSFWDPGYVRWLKGGTIAGPESIVVTTDGSGVLVRARGMRDPSSERPAVDGGYAIYSQWNGGEGMAWAIDMAEVVKPCLKPASSPAPWDKVLAVESKGK